MPNPEPGPVKSRKYRRICIIIWIDALGEQKIRKADRGTCSYSSSAQREMDATGWVVMARPYRQYRASG